jgi:hypothetical protein
MRTFLEKAHDLSSIGTFIFTIVLVALTVAPMLWPPHVTPEPVANGGRSVIGWVMPSILAFCLVGAGVLNVLAARERRKSNSAHSQAPVAMAGAALQTVGRQLAPGRVPTNATPAELAEIWKHNTGLQAKKLSELYIGTWMSVSGVVFDVRKPNPTEGLMCVTLHSVPGVTIVPCRFNEEWDHRCSVLRKNETVTIIGKVEDFDSEVFSLKECELA